MEQIEIVNELLKGKFALISQEKISETELESIPQLLKTKMQG